MALVPESTCGAFTLDDVSAAVNRAADDILEAVDAGDEGLRDALNLMVNATLGYLDEGVANLHEVIASAYSLDEEDGGPLEWIERGMR